MMIFLVISVVNANRILNRVFLPLGQKVLVSLQLSVADKRSN